MSIMTLISEPSISLAQPLLYGIKSRHPSNSLPLRSFIAQLSLDRQLSTKILDLWTHILNTCHQAWWVEIFTAQPKCTYYFGPFAGAGEAEIASIGFVADLEGEFAQGIETKIDRHSQPDLLTIEHDLLA
jgi:hypothetical protein